MAARVMRRQSYPAEGYSIPVMENSVYTSGRIGFNPVGSEGKVLASAAAHNIGISVHNHVTRVGLPEHLCCASHVVRVRLSIEENLCIFPGKSQLLNACADQRRRALKIRVDQDVSRRGRNQVGCQVATPNAIEVVGNLEGGKWSCPVRIVFCFRLQAGKTEAKGGN
jgi:hypothetical protein